MVRAILKFYNCIIERGEIPDSLKLAVKIPILKSKKKTHTFDHHRGINLLSPLIKYWSVLYYHDYKDSQSVTLISYRVAIKNNRMHSRLVGAYFGSSMFADNLTTLSRMKSGLDRMLECTWEYGVGESFFVRLIRWKWNRTSNLTGFLPEIVRILLKYDLMDTSTEYILQDRFPSKNSCKKVVNEYVESLTKPDRSAGQLIVRLVD